jgi:hypothetical protein
MPVTQPDSDTAPGSLSHADAFGAFLRLRLRTPAHATKLVWVYVAPLLHPSQSRPLSVHAIARQLDTKTKTVRRSLEHLGWIGLINCTVQPGQCTAGHYRHGALFL